EFARLHRELASCANPSISATPPSPHHRSAGSPAMGVFVSRQAGGPALDPGRTPRQAPRLSSASRPFAGGTRAVGASPVAPVPARDPGLFFLTYDASLRPDRP